MIILGVCCEHPVRETDGERAERMMARRELQARLDASRDQSLVRSRELADAFLAMPLEERRRKLGLT